MSNRVVASQQAVQAAQEMKRILDGNLSDTIQQLRHSGMVLSNPAMWDGPMARDFRSTMWPRSQATMEGTLVQLQKMQGWALKINQDIMRAGSEGGGTGGPTGGSPSVTTAASVAAPIVYDITHLSLRSFYNAAKATFANLAKLADHMNRHWTDVGFPWSEGMYANAANKFLLEAKAAGYEAKVAGQTLRLWDSATRTFAAYTLDGLTRTIFVPDAAQHPGDTYWHNPSYGQAATDAELERAMMGAAQGLEDAVKSPLAKLGQLMDSPLGRLGNRALGALGAVGDVLTIIHPSANALGGANLERWMAVGNLGAMAVTAGPVAGLLAANAGLDWIPGVGEVVMAGTALYFVGDLIYQNREAIGHALSWAGHGIANVASDIGHGLASGASHAWHAIFG